MRFHELSLFSADEIRILDIIRENFKKDAMEVFYSTPVRRTRIDN